MQVVCYVANPHLKELLENILRSSCLRPPIMSSSIDEFKQAFDEVPNVDMCICETTNDFKNEKISRVKDVLKKFFIGNEKLDQDNYFHMSDIASFLKRIQKELVEREGKDIESDYISMPIHLFRHFNTIDTDVYLKVKHETGIKFIKRIPAGENIDRGLIDDYLVKGVKELYFHKDFKTEFSKILFNNLVNRVDYNDSSTDYHKFQEEVFVSLKDLVHNLGIKKPIINVCEATIQSIEKEMSRLHGPWKKALSKLLESNEQSYHLRFVRLTCLFIAQYFEAKNWPAKEQVSKKLYYASFFCDMNIDQERLLKIRNNYDVGSLSDVEQKRIMLHAKKNAENVKNYPGISEDILQIILLHHGSKSGVGFCHDTTDKLPELVKIFMICQDLADLSLSKPKASLEEITLELKQNYSETQFEKIIDTFLELSNESLLEGA